MSNDPTEVRLALVENNMLHLGKKYDELNEHMVKMITDLAVLVQRHDKDLYDTPGVKADLRALTEADKDRKRMVNMFQVALVATLVEPVVIGLAWWLLYGNKMVQLAP